MALIPQGARFGMFLHLLSSRLHIAIMLGAAAALIAEAMSLWG